MITVRSPVTGRDYNVAEFWNKSGVEMFAGSANCDGEYDAGSHLGLAVDKRPVQLRLRGF